MAKRPITTEALPFAKSGARLFWLRSHLGLTQPEISTAIGTDQSNYSRWERGKRPIPRDMAVSICAKYSLTTDFLHRGLSAGLDRKWVDLLLSTPEGISLLEPGGSDRGI